MYSTPENTLGAHEKKIYPMRVHLMFCYLLHCLSPLFHDLCSVRMYKPVLRAQVQYLSGKSTNIMHIEKNTVVLTSDTLSQAW